MTLPSGSSESIVGIGTIELSDKIVLKNVLFVPAFHFNLLSVSSLTRDLYSMVSSLTRDIYSMVSSLKQLRLSFLILQIMMFVYLP